MPNVNQSDSIVNDGLGVDPAHDVPQPETLEDLAAIPRFGVYALSASDGRLRYLVRGESERGFGDTIHGTFAGAQSEAEIERRRAESRARSLERSARENAEREAARKAEEQDDFSGFAAGMTAMQRGRIRSVLGKQFRFSRFGGRIMTRREYIDALHEAGDLSVSHHREPRVKPMSRSQFNRATQAQQDAHERKMREGGEKTVYFVNNSEMPKVAHDYAQHLLGQAAEPTPGP